MGLNEPPFVTVLAIPVIPLRARAYPSQNREIRLRVLIHNLAILWRPPDLLYRAGLSPLFHIHFVTHSSRPVFQNPFKLLEVKAQLSELVLINVLRVSVRSTRSVDFIQHDLNLALLQFKDVLKHSPFSPDNGN